MSPAPAGGLPAPDGGFLVIEEPFGTGHGPNALAGLVAAAEAAELSVAVCSPRLPEALVGRCQHLASVKSRRPWGLRRGLTLRHDLRLAADRGAELFVALTADYAVNAPVRPRVELPSAAVLHSAHHVDVRGGALRSRLRRRVATANLAAWARAGGALVCHTPAARRQLATAVGEPVVQLGWPVVAASSELVAAAPQDLRVLFCGRPRPGKGFDQLVRALAEVPAVEALEVNGPLSEAEEAEAVRRLAGRRVQAGPAWLEEGAYRATFTRAALAVLPYSHGAPDRATVASASLLDVLAAGVPAVVTEVLADQLPPDYGGAVVVASDDAAALRDGIRAAVGRLGELTAAARVLGPAHVRAHHTFEAYLSGLRAAAAERWSARR